MISIRFWPTIISFACTSLLLGAAHLTYQHFTYEVPIERSLSQLAGIESYTYKVGNQSIVIRAKFSPAASMKDIYAKINKDLNSVVRGRTLYVLPTNEPDDALNAYWTSASLPVTQAIDSNNYSDIPKLLQSIHQDGSIHTGTEVDERFIYITLSNSSNAKFIQFVRNP
ncbi:MULTISPECIES: hypothetical protein [unclassified Paenibacillus]|uniref:hypothetical protein n=1 Tax=unclassified Paenibacillus TaxID=185978 RepID=UPI0027826C1A|nr:MULTISPECIES: hypothetical protein [unclassified Paenibacillus]MDQ0896363.1 hypothetical protein [Paenibacillus sp. V4I7]MDQ0914093.1 hypothetical protein [Paenibacillus sp. V4I5]